MTVTAEPVVERVSPAAPEPAGGPVRRRIDVTAALGLAGLVALALALRLEGIGTWYWIDEALSVGIARHDLVDIPSLLLRDGSPPLWYLLAHLWTAAFGSSVVATHAMSTVFGVASVPLAWFASRRLFGLRTAWFAAALTAISPFVVHFSRETRMYSLVVLLSFGVASTFVRAFVDRRPRVEWAFAALLVALLYTHNWGIYTAFASAVALAVLALLSDDGGRLLRRGALVLAVVGVAYVPWLPVLVSQAQNTGAPWSFTPSVREVVRELAALFRDERVLVALGLATVTGLTPLVRRRPTRDGLAVTCLMMLTAVPVIVGWAVAHVEPSWATRYLAVVVGPMLLVVAVGLARARLVGIGALAVAAVLILQPITRLEGTFRVPADAKSNAHAVAERMAPRLAPGDLVLVAQPEAVPLLHHELGDDLTYADPTGIVEDPTVMDWRDALPRLQAATHAADTAPLVDALAPGARVLVVLAGNDAKRTDTDWITSFRSAGRRIQQALRSDPGLVTVDRIRGSERPYVTFDAVLYERRAG